MKNDNQLKRSRFFRSMVADGSKHAGKPLQLWIVRGLWALAGRMAQ